MPKIRIVDPNSGFRFSLPVPYRLFVNLFVRRSLVMNVLHGQIRALTDERDRCAADEGQRRAQLEERIRHLETLRQIADSFDFGELRYALTHISAYKGLTLVDVQAADGTIVHITL